MSASASPIPARSEQDGKPTWPVIVFGGDHPTDLSASICGQDHLHVDLVHQCTLPVRVELEFRTPEDVYAFAADLMRCYDKMVGI